MLNLIGKTLALNEIDNSFVKGNVWARNSAIKKFKMGKNIKKSKKNDIIETDNKVIMLSLKNAASGTNLTEATHIFFVEPINSDREESIAIESQAIARACRVGQKKQVLLTRILIENTIEEDIYKNHYNKNIII
jgi:SNF2 family DNA or RNA helicase